jgi:alpha-pyrone synthase
VANALFADGAAAVVGRAAGEIASGWNVVSLQSLLLRETSDLMSWRIGDHGFVMTLSPQVPDVIRQHLSGWLSEWLANRELSLADVRSWAIHPGGPRILTACEAALALGEASLETSRQILATYGNMSSPTILFILDGLRRQSAPLPCVALAFGPGLTLEAALLDRVPH